MSGQPTCGRRISWERKSESPHRLWLVPGSQACTSPAGRRMPSGPPPLPRCHHGRPPRLRHGPSLTRSGRAGTAGQPRHRHSEGRTAAAGATVGSARGTHRRCRSYPIRGGAGGTGRRRGAGPARLRPPCAATGGRPGTAAALGGRVRRAARGPPGWSSRDGELLLSAPDGARRRRAARRGPVRCPGATAAGPAAWAELPVRDGPGPGAPGRLPVPAGCWPHLTASKVGTWYVRRAPRPAAGRSSGTPGGGTTRPTSSSRRWRDTRCGWSLSSGAWAAGRRWGPHAVGEGPRRPAAGRSWARLPVPAGSTTCPTPACRCFVQALRRGRAVRNPGSVEP